MYSLVTRARLETEPSCRVSLGSQGYFTEAKPRMDANAECGTAIEMGTGTSVTRMLLQAKRVGQKFADRAACDIGKILGGCDEDGTVRAAEFGHDLATGSTGEGHGTRRHDGDGSEFLVASGHRGEDRGPLGAVGETVRRILDITARKYLAGFCQHRGTYLVLGIGCMGIPHRLNRALQ